MHPLAEELNEIIKKGNIHIYEMLSDLGKKLYFPKGILSQSAEAKKFANKYNATIGVATEGDQPMFLPSAYRCFNELLPRDLFLYAPASGIPQLREKWKEKMLQENPQLQNKNISHPLVTNALTHGLSIVADLFTNPQDKLILPDKLWGNYKLIFGVRKEADIEYYPFYDANGGFNITGFRETVEKCSSTGKLIILLNFPNNPTGYSISKTEAEEIVEILNSIAKKGCNTITVMDDAYFGLFYEEETLKESLFGYLANSNKRLLAIRLDGATKEEFAWGFRVGFITYGSADTPNEVYEALEKKTMGAIRGNISNCPRPSQTVVLTTLESPTFRQEQQKKFEILKNRALEVKNVLKTPKYDEAWNVYPFNSGYFMCVQLKTVNAEQLRQHLLKNYGIGIIAINETDVRIAFSCLEINQIPDLFELIYQAIKELEK
ncbi:MAG: aminotransferase class I/II-fold pyridoxal phosphate-dependent enzyme [Candidatus Helarchaeota archaeon]|nr:aminotransferase class I/II-fold pyridoxal phosphate-dependent enzyme [Candidatus Helarchaeota archaeon]